MSEQHPQTNGGRLLKRGDTFDIEDSRQTHRLQAAHAILREQGIEPTRIHSDYQVAEWGRLKHSCDYRCKTVWPEWVDGPIFDAAYALADLVISRRGEFNRRSVA